MKKDIASLWLSIVIYGAVTVLALKIHQMDAQLKAQAKELTEANKTITDLISVGHLNSEALHLLLESVRMLKDRGSHIQ